MIPKRQFILTKKNLDGDYKEMGEYKLYLGLEEEYILAKSIGIEIHLIGNIYDWEKPYFSNEDILYNIFWELFYPSDIIYRFNHYCGEYVVIIRWIGGIYIFNDAAAQKEIYYDTEFNCFASQPILIDSENYQENFYNSQKFIKKSYFILDETHRKNVKHLLPNHYIYNNKVKRFYPNKPNLITDSDSAAGKANNMIKGYLEAMSLRHNIAIAVTGGFDTRILFLASKDLDCQYYIHQIPEIKNNDIDVRIARKLTGIYNKKLDIIPYKIQDKTQDIDGIDFPRYLNPGVGLDKDVVMINGNISEVARNRIGYYRNLSGIDLAFLSGYDIEYPATIYSRWLLNKPLFDTLNYNYLDMLYWEDRMTNWAAKFKTEMAFFGRTVLSPFNSRELLEVLLGTKRSLRDFYDTKLYKIMISKLCENKPEIINLSFNPTIKRKFILIAKQLRLFRIFKYINLKLRITPEF